MDETNIRYVHKKLGEAIGMLRAEGIDDVDIGAGLGLLIAQIAPSKADRDALLDFADRHEVLAAKPSSLAVN